MVYSIKNLKLFSGFYLSVRFSLLLNSNVTKSHRVLTLHSPQQGLVSKIDEN
jgi:hypothetical protein